MGNIPSQKIRGLVTSANSISETPEGSLSRAQNCVIDSDSIIESRRGFEAIALGNSADRIDCLTSYQDLIVARRSNDDKLSRYNGSVWTDYSGTYSNPDDDLARMKFAQMNSNLYFTTSTGIQMLDEVTGVVYGTGMPKGLDGVASNSGVSGFQTDNTQVAYRIVWGTRDVNNNLYLGAPSQRIIVSNSTGGTRDVSLTFTIPGGITTGDFYQIYRSSESSSSTAEPNDELQLVYEANPSAGEITAKSITVVDSTPDSMKGAYLYSNANQEGIQESNDIPPYASDLCLFKDFLFFANVKTKQSLDINLLACGGSSGLVADDTITIDGMVFTAKAAEDIANRQFKVFSAGSAAQNIDDTARSLIKVVNQYTSNTTVYAYYITGYNDLPGQIRIEDRDLSTTTFAVSTSRSTAFDLNDGTSSNNEYPHGIMWSKIQQPEHVPSSHLEFAGSKGHPIRRIVPLRDSLFILKDDGVFKLTGTNGSWNIEPVDTSTKILAPESAVVLNNQIFALTDQGIVTISDLGVAVISRPIEDQITSLLGLSYENLKNLSFGVSYETDRKYILYTVSDDADSNPTIAFVYNVFTKAWTSWDKPATTGIVNRTDGKLYLAKPDGDVLFKERKSFTATDYTDEAITGLTISSVTGTSIVLSDVSSITVGDILYQSSILTSPIMDVDSATNTVTIDSEVAFTVAACSVLKSIECIVEWNQQTAGQPSLEKHFQEIALLFKKQSFVNATASFYTDHSGGYEDVTISGNYGTEGWGSSPWGEGLWGGITRPIPIRVFIPLDKSRGSLLVIRFKIKQAYALWQLQGYNLMIEGISERTNRE